jgi:hypothetical protein
MRSNVLVVLALAVGAVGFVACEDDDDDEIRWEATLVGTEEDPTPVTTTADGDFVMTDNGTNFTYTLRVRNIESVIAGGAHLHIAPPPALPTDTFGPVIVGLSPTVSVTPAGSAFVTLAQGSFTQGTATTNPITLDSLRTLLNAGRVYVNVHTVTHTGGHIRGPVRRD